MPSAPDRHPPSPGQGPSSPERSSPLGGLDAGGLDAGGGAPSTQKPPTHAGGVVWRPGPEGSPLLLLVRPRTGPAVWVLPKGHIEPGETPPQAAVREVQEESGVVARIEAELSTLRFDPPAPADRVLQACFLLRALRLGASPEDRPLLWAGPAEAEALAGFSSVRLALREAAERLSQR